MVYRFFLRKTTHFHFNRAFLILSVVSSMVWPLIDFSSYHILPIYHIDLPGITIGSHSTLLQDETSISFTSWMKYLYMSVAFLLIVKFSIQLYTILKIRKASQSSLSLVDQKRIFITSQDNFSFFHWIFIKEEDQNNQAIYFHEMEHSRLWHSLDIIILKVFQIVFWFNPFMFLIEKELRLQHEFAVDQRVLNRGTEKINYQQLLLNQIFKTEFNLVTNNFNKTFLKSRFIMMTKKENRKVSKWILMAFMTLVIISPLAISCSMDEAQPEEIKKEASVEKSTETQNPPQEVVSEEKTSTEDPIFMVVEVMPQFPGGEKAMYAYIGENVEYPAAAKEAGVQGRVFVEFIVEKDGSITNIKTMEGIGSGCDEAAMKVFKSMPNWTPGKQRGENVRVQFRMPISFKLK